MTGGMVTKVRRHITNPESSVWSQVTTESIWRLVKNLDLLQAQLGMSSCNRLPEVVREGIEHRVVGVHRGEPVLVQLVRHYNQSSHRQFADSVQGCSRHQESQASA